VVKIFAFLDLEQISADFEIERFETGSLFLKIKNFGFCGQIYHMWATIKKHV